MNRRSFLVTLTGAVLSQGFSVAQSGGQRLGKIGLELYTVRRELEKDFEGTLVKLPAIGYEELEFAGYFGHAPREVKAILDGQGLAAPSAHISFASLREGWQAVLDSAHLIGHQFLICASVPPEARRTLDDWKRAGELFDRAGEASRRAGIQFAYHNHDFEFAQVNGQIPYDILLAKTDSALVQLQMDLYWITKGGQDPLKYFALYPGRFPLVHVKDMDSTPRHFFTEVGRGTIDFKRIFAQAAAAGVKHYFVEQDECPGSPFDSIKISFDYLKALQF